MTPEQACRARLRHATLGLCAVTLRALDERDRAHGRPSVLLADLRTSAADWRGLVRLRLAEYVDDGSDW